MKKVLYDFHWDYGRMGTVQGRFISTEEDVDCAVGSQIYFGEILGKHSQVYGTFNWDDVVGVTDDQEFLAKAEELGIDLETGYNPLNYIDDDEDDDDEDEEE